MNEADAMRAAGFTTRVAMTLTDRVIAYLDAQHEPATTDDIATALGTNRPSVLRVLRRCGGRALLVGQRPPAGSGRAAGLWVSA